MMWGLEHGRGAHHPLIAYSMPRYRRSEARALLRYVAGSARWNKDVRAIAMLARGKADCGGKQSVRGIRPPPTACTRR
jgi:hypothetical protein